jgi:hypothetical protein
MKRSLCIVLMLTLAMAGMATPLLSSGCGDSEGKVNDVGNSSDNSARQSNNGSSGPLSADALSGDWADIAASVAGGIFLGTEKGALFYAYDTLAYPGEPADLTARLQKGDRLSGIEGVTLGFYLEDKRVAKATTDASGRAVATWTPPKAGNYRMDVQIEGVADEAFAPLLEASAASLLVAAKPRGTRLVVIDLDHTVVASSFFRVLTFGAKPMAGSQRVTQRIAKEYGIVYLTQRPDLLTVKSKSWLIEHDYPPGPLIVSDISEVADSGKYKSARLGLIGESYPNLAIGIGDKLSDVDAYIRNGMKAYLIPHYDNDDVEEMRELAQAIRRLPTGNGRLHVVDSWQQIEAGIFDGKKFAPDAYARALEQRADRLARQQREDDDDDDNDDD